MKPQLIIDSNERGLLCESVERKAQRAGLTVARQVLVVGDYQLGGACVEAKSIGDLFQSSHSGHLWRQLDNMDANYERFFLVYRLSYLVFATLFVSSTLFLKESKIKDYNYSFTNSPSKLSLGYNGLEPTLFCSFPFE